MRLFWLTLLVMGTLAVDFALFAVWKGADLYENCGTRGDPGGLNCEDWFRNSGDEAAVLIWVVSAAAVLVGVWIWRRTSDAGES